MSEWISTALELPKSDGAYRVKYELWRNGRVIDSGVDMEMFEFGHFKLTDLEESGEAYRNITHWMPIING